MMPFVLKLVLQSTVSFWMQNIILRYGFLYVWLVHKKWFESHSEMTFDLHCLFDFLSSLSVYVQSHRHPSASSSS
jgi:hypothetical protein